MQATLEVELRQLGAQATRLEGEAQAAVAWQQARIESERTASRAKLVQAEKLPELAAAVGQRIGEVRIAQYGGGNPFASITQAVGAVLELVRDARPTEPMIPGEPAKE